MPAFDAIVIGAGQAGPSLAFRLAATGRRVAMVERDAVGGTCVNTGCTPTKTMIASAQVAHYARQAGRWGVRTAEVSVDLPAVVARKDKIVGQWRALSAIPAQTAESKAMSKDLKRLGFRFVGPTVCYAFMQAVGLVNDHTTSCFRYKELT